MGELSREYRYSSPARLARRLAPDLALEIDFKGCILLPLLLLLFEKPSAAGQDPEITFANRDSDSFRAWGQALEMCTNCRPFKAAKVEIFSTFHVV